MRANRLQELVPLLEVLPVLARLCPKKLQRLVSLERSTVDTSDDGSESGVIVEVPEPVRDVDELLDLSRPVLGFVMTEDQRHDPG